MTLNQIIAEIKKFASQHAMINDVGVGDLAEIGASKDQKYALLWVYYNTVNMTGNAQVIPFRVILMDLIDQEKSLEVEVHSNMLQVAQDFIAHFRGNPEFATLDVTGDPTIQFFTDRFTDLVAGVDLNINFKDLKPYDRCVIPTV